MACDDVRKPEFFSLYKYLRPKASKWHDLGLAFGLKMDALTNIRRNFTYVEDCLKEMLDQVCKTKLKLTWKDVIEALRCVSESVLAHELEKQLTEWTVEMPDKDPSESLALKAANKENIAFMKRKHAQLVRKIEKNLKKVEPDMKDFHSFIIDVFDASELPKVDTIQEMFDILTEKKCWSFMDVSNLESIVEEFSEDLDEHNRKLIKEYKEDLAGFKAATKIVDFMNFKMEREFDSDDIECVSIASDKAKYDEKFRKKLSIKLKEGKWGIKITSKSLEYVEKLWDSLCEQFEMPSLSIVLDNIISGSIIITWIVRRIHAQKILDNIFHAAGFLKQELIVGMYLEGVCIYDEMSGIAMTKIINYTRLLMLEQEGNLQQETAMLESYFPDINSPINQEGRSLLTMAAQCGHKGLLKFLLDNGADAFHTDHGGKDVLTVSAAQEDINIWLKMVLVDKLITSAKDGDSSTVRRALEFGIHPDAKAGDEFAWTALLWACENGHQEIVDYLLQHGATPDIEDKKGWTGLMLATRNGNFNIVRSMLDKGANPNKTTNCWTPLMWTAEHNYPEIAKLLLEKGADPNIYDTGGCSPLFQAAYAGHFDVVKALVENSEKLDINHTTELDWSALAVAVKDGHENIVRYLVEHGADISYEKKDGSTVLHVACCKGHFAIASFLCKKKRVNVNVQDEDGLIPLMFAAHQGQLNLVKLLVQDGRADLNLTEHTNSWSALFFAMQAGHQEVMEYLLSTKRIDMTHKDVEGNTIFDLAGELNTKAFKYLEKNFKPEMDKVGESKPIVKTIKETGETYYFDDMICKIMTKASFSSLKTGTVAA